MSNIAFQREFPLGEKTHKLIGPVIERNGRKMANANIRAIKINCGFCKRWMPLVLCNKVLQTVSPYFSIILTSVLLDEIVEGIPSANRFGVWVGVLLAGSLLISVLSKVLDHACASAYEELANKERYHLGNKFMKCKFQVIESEEFHKLQRTIDENQRINGAGRDLLLRTSQDLISGFLSLLLAIVLFGDLLIKVFKSGFDVTVLIFVALIVAFAVANILLAKYKQKKNLEMSGVIGDMMTDEGRYDDAIDSYQIGKDVRLYGLTSLIMNFKKKYLMDDHIKNFKWMMNKNFLYTIPEVLSSFLTELAIYMFLISFVLKGNLTVGSILMYVGLVKLMIGAIRTIILDVSAIKNNTGRVSEYLKQFDLPEENNSGTCDVCEEDSLYWDFVDVSFRYEGSDTWALRNINLHLDNKMWYTLIGENGSGKTTLIKLLCRLYMPTEGKILLNGRDIMEYDFRQYVSLIATVFQDFKLFSFTLGENVALSEQYDEDRVLECIKKVHLFERYSQLPLQMKTPLYMDFDPSGVEVSGGEGQKIAIARAMYKDAELMILDEPTAALDPRSENEIYTMVSRAIKDNTAIFISHRLSACRLCHKIIVLHHGKLIEEGTHDELVGKGGKYSELWNAQSQLYS